MKNNLLNMPLIKTVLKNLSLPVRALLFFCFVSAAGPRREEINDPDRDRFTREVLADHLDEPMGMTFIGNGRVVVIERKGAVKIYDPALRKMKTIATLPVNTEAVRKDGKVVPIEEGLMGVIADPDYSRNHQVYFYYADTGRPVHVLARWQLIGDRLITSSRKQIIEVPIRREPFKCSGGSMAFDRSGNLYLATGTNTVYITPDTVRESGGTYVINTNETETAGNTNDLRGKILRIRPLEKGGYEVPEGNLFPRGMANTRPEIYVMGTRNAWRISLDSKTGFLHWADPGRDDDKDDVARNNGKGFDEFNIARQAGNFGWPFFVGDNRLYYGVSTTTGDAQRALHPQNTSARQNGLTELPPAQPPVIWYKYGLSKQFPVLGNGGRSAVGGPVYHRDDHPKALRPFPSFYEGKWFISDFIRGWIMTVDLKADGTIGDIEPFLPDENFSSILDMGFSPEGDLYVMEYGTSWFSANANARLVRVVYNGGNRKPVIRWAAEKANGPVPRKVCLSGAGTVDPDGDPVRYEWKVMGKGFEQKLNGSEVEVNLKQAGSYQVSLTVTDDRGARSNARGELTAGNEAPEVRIALNDANTTFFFEGDTLEYQVKVRDREDGTLEQGGIPARSVFYSIDYTSLPYDRIPASLWSDPLNRYSRITTGQILIGQMDCRSCHQLRDRSAGPSYEAIAKKYASQPDQVRKLADKVISGGSGVWGTQAMSAHPDLNRRDAMLMVQYILSLLGKEPVKTQPIQGRYIMRPPAEEQPYGTFLLKAAYTDKGHKGQPPQSGQFIQMLRYPRLLPEQSTIRKGCRQIQTPSPEFMIEGDGAYFAFDSLDLTYINRIQLNVFAEKWKGVSGGYIECRLDSPAGMLLGKSRWVEAVEDGSMAKLTFDISDKPVRGRHDLYFIFRNEAAPVNQFLMSAYSVDFFR